MKKILLVGSAPLPFEDEEITYASGTRTWQILSSLIKEQSSYEIEAFLILPPIRLNKESFTEIKIKNCSIRHITLEEALSGKFIDKKDFKNYCAVVGVNTQPCYAVAKMHPPIPFWADLNGYIVTEKYSGLTFQEQGFSLLIPPFYESLIFRKANRISTATLNQKHCIIGKIASIRKSEKPLSYNEIIQYIPNAIFKYDPKIKNAKKQPPLVQKENFNIFWCSGYNKWMDRETLYKGLELAMNKRPQIRFISTTGIISEQTQKNLKEFYKKIQKGPHKDKFIFTSYLPKKEFNLYMSKCDLGLICDKSDYETLIGARTRTNEMIQQKIPIITSKSTELSQIIDSNNLSPVYEPGDYKELARQIIAAVDNLGPLKRNAQKTYQYLRRYYRPEMTTKALSGWVENFSNE
ncbi:MAG: glycosyltransferase [Candidatus Moraniibacteriota bacterium]